MGMNAGIEFARWLENCIRDAREKLKLDWPEILMQLLHQAKRITLEIILEKDRKIE